MLTWKARLLPAPLVVPQASAILVLAATRRSVLTGPPPRPALYCKRESRAGRLLVMENTIKNILVHCGVEFDTYIFFKMFSFTRRWILPGTLWWLAMKPIVVR